MPDRRRNRVQSYSPGGARAHWRHMANMIELVLPSAHPSPYPKRQMDPFSHFCTAHGTVSSGMPWHVLSPNNYPLRMGIWAQYTRLNASLGSPDSTTQTASRSVQPFLQGSLVCVTQTNRKTTLYSVGKTAYVRSTAM